MQLSGPLPLPLLRFGDVIESLKNRKKNLITETTNSIKVNREVMEEDRGYPCL